MFVYRGDAVTSVHQLNYRNILLNVITPGMLFIIIGLGRRVVV